MLSSSMASSGVLLLLLLAFLAPPCMSLGPYGPFYPSCSLTSNYTSGSAFEANLAQLLAALPRSAIKNGGFANDTTGAAPDTVYGLMMCLVDYSWDNCQNCLHDAASGITEVCPYAKTVSAAYTGCLLRYSSVPFFSTAAVGVVYYTTGYNYSVEPSGFGQVRAQLMGELAQTAAASPLRLAYGNRTYNSTHRLYGMVQCTRDLPADECARCLADYNNGSGYSFMKLYFTGYSCYLHYDVNPFNVTVPLSEASAQAPSQGPKRNTTLVVAAVSSVAGLCFVIILGCCFHHNSRRRRQSQQIGSVPQQFALKELKEATRNFSGELQLGKGAFGVVYKGTLRGEVVAVKRLQKQQEVGSQQFENEVNILMGLRHRNLVRLVGYCNEDQERLLCFEYLPRGSLDNLLYGEHARLNWRSRYTIITGICSGLHYLHGESEDKHKILHMDLKPNNILIHDNQKGGFSAKISDFGISRLSDADQPHSYINQVVGPIGYMAPEYLNKGKLSAKVDIYSFGVLVLEMVTGRRGSSFSDSCSSDEFINYVRHEWSEGGINKLKDPTLGEECIAEIQTCIEIALDCVQTEPTKRPDTGEINNRLKYKHRGAGANHETSTKDSA